MSFREALAAHLRAIQEREADGKLVRTTAAFLEAHRGWFAMTNWTLHAEEVELFEGEELAVAVLRLDYREPPDVRAESYLTLVFQRHDGKWRMVQDQNTPLKK